MIERQLSLPILGLIAGTRVALGVGLGFLLGERLDRERRQACGWALFAVGTLSTIPLALEVFRGGPAEAAHRPTERRAVKHRSNGHHPSNRRRRNRAAEKA